MMFFFFNDTATTEIYTLSLHDALPICVRGRHLLLRGVRRPPEWRRARDPSRERARSARREARRRARGAGGRRPECGRSEEHTSELQSRQYLVCRLLLEKKNWSDCSSYY